MSYDDFVKSKKELDSSKWAEPRQYRAVAQSFRAMNGYSDTAELAKECENKAEQLEKQREEQKRIKQEQERIERERSEEQERIDAEQKKIKQEQWRIKCEAKTEIKQRNRLQLGAVYGLIAGVGIGALSPLIFVGNVGGVIFIAILILCPVICKKNGVNGLSGIAFGFLICMVISGFAILISVHNISIAIVIGVSTIIGTITGLLIAQQINKKKKWCDGH